MNEPRRPIGRPGRERPGHPTAKAAVLLVVVTLLLIALAALSTF